MKQHVFITIGANYRPVKMLRITIVLILGSFVIALVWTKCSNWLYVENERYKAFVCDSFTVGLTKGEVRNKYGEPFLQCKPDDAPSPDYEVWTYHFGQQNNDIVGGIVNLIFEGDRCTQSQSMMGLKEHDRLFLWAMVLQRYLTKGSTTIGHSEKILAAQFGTAPVGMGYPIQSEAAKRYGILTGAD